MPFNPDALLEDGPVVLSVKLEDSEEEVTPEISEHLTEKVTTEGMYMSATLR